jgi:hypothetical protein
MVDRRGPHLREEDLEVFTEVKSVAVDGMSMGLQLTVPVPIPESPGRDTEQLGGFADGQVVREFLRVRYLGHDRETLANLVFL